MTKLNSIRFSSAENKQFYATLRKRVDEYFKTKNISKTGNYKLFIKTFVMILLYLAPLAIMLTLSLPWYAYVLGLVLMIFGMAGVGFCVMHDANHGSYSKINWLNKLLGHTMIILGGNAQNWKVQHGEHHTYTNVHDHDHDISTISLLRFSPETPKKKIHKYQHWYAWFFYGFLTLSWISLKDFFQFFKFKNEGLIQKYKGNSTSEFWLIIFSKVLYYTLFLALPIILIDLPVWWIIIGFIAMHFFAGIIISTVFQLAHVMEESDFPKPDETGTIQNQWAIHQLKTTVNFSNSRILNWSLGGLNRQIEHHLFPDISHVHYNEISKIVRQTAEEFGIPYNFKPTLASAFISHINQLKKLGREY